MKMEGHMLESIKSVEDIIRDNGCITFNNLTAVANYLNNVAINYEPPINVQCKTNSNRNK